MKLKATDKQPIQGEEQAKHGVLIHCFLYDRSYLTDDELVDEWSPDGCIRRAYAYDSLLPEGWAYHDQFLLCPTCEDRWQKKWPAVPRELTQKEQLAAIMGAQ